MGLAASLVAGLALAPVSSEAAGPIARSSGNCHDVTFIGAAGSGELKDSKKAKQFHHVGPEVDKMASVMGATLWNSGGLTLARLPDVYPADGVEELAPSVGEVAGLFFGGGLGASLALDHYKHYHFDKYMNSIAAGVQGAISLATDTVANCPSTSLVLAGYSQGAMVMHQAELKLAAMGRRNVLSHIAGTLLLGDGDQVAHSRGKRFGSASAGAEGIRTVLTPGRGTDVKLGATTANICDDRDIVCDFHLGSLLHIGEDTAVHSNYLHRPILANAANWIANKILAGASRVIFDGSPGTGPPPATLGPFTMTPFGPDPQAAGQVGSVAGPTGTVTFPTPLDHEMVAVGWATWSNGYTGDVYISDSSDRATVQLPSGTRAFYLYAEPNIFEDFNVAATSSEGTTSGPVTVQGESGATYFGFYALGKASLSEITVTADDLVAVGEFGIAP